MVETLGGGERRYAAAIGPMFALALQLWGQHLGAVGDGAPYFLEPYGFHYRPGQVSGVVATAGREQRAMRDLENRLGLHHRPPGGSPMSGAVEGGHRSVIQDRLKLPGTWWSEETVNPMLALRSLRANNRWEAFWN